MCPVKSIFEPLFNDLKTPCLHYSTWSPAFCCSKITFLVTSLATTFNQLKSVNPSVCLTSPACCCMSVWILVCACRKRDKNNFMWILGMKSPKGDHCFLLDQSFWEEQGVLLFYKAEQRNSFTVQPSSHLFSLLIHLPSLSFPCVQFPQILSPSAVIIETPTPFSLSPANTNTHTRWRHCPPV